MIHFGRAKATIVSAALALTLFGVINATTSAQYPPVQGSVSLAVSNPVVPVGGNTTLSTQIVNEAGQPIANAPVTFSIVSEPGTDAAVGSKVVTRTPAANGVATTNLYVGTTPGVIVVSATSGSFSSTSIVQVTGPGAAGAPAPGPAVAPLSPASPILPPNTGDAGLAATAHDGSLTILALLLPAPALLAGAAMRRSRAN